MVEKDVLEEEIKEKKEKFDEKTEETIDEVDENEIRNRIIDGKYGTSSYNYLNKENGDYSDGKE